MFKKLLLGLCLAVATTNAGAAPANSQGSQAIQAFVCLSNQSGIEQAVKVAACTALIESGSFPGEGLWAVYFARARAYGSMGDHGHAMADLNRSIELDATHGEVFLTRGIAYRALMQMEPALADLNEMIRIFPDQSNPLFTMALYTRGLTRLNMQNFDGALEDFTATIERDPNQSGAYAGRAAVYLLQSNTEAALADADRAIELNPQDPVARFTRGTLFGLQHEYQRSEGDMTVVISANPNHSGAFEWRARARQSLENYEGALEDFEMAARLAPTNAGTHNSLCWVGGILATNLDRAMTSCNEAIRLDPAAAYIDSRGFVHLRRGEYSEAIVDYTTAISLNPQLAESFFGRGIARLRRGETEQGEADIAAALALRDSVEEQFRGYGVTR